MESGLRAICRVFHFASLLGMGMYLAADHLGSPDARFKQAGHFSGIGFIVSGLINWFVLRKFKREDNARDFRMWTGIIHSKLLIIVLFFTPLAKMIVKDSHCLFCVRLAFMLIYVVLSPYARMLREACQSQKPKTT